MSQKAGRKPNASYYARHASSADDSTFQAKRGERLRCTSTGDRVDRFEAEFNPRRPAMVMTKSMGVAALVKTSRNGKRKVYKVVR